MKTDLWPEKKIGFLTLLDYIPGKDYRRKNGKRTHASWKVICDCHTITVVTADNLRRGITRSCGKCNLIPKVWEKHRPRPIEGRIVVHTKTGNKYRILSTLRIKMENGEWIDGFYYENMSGEKFARSQESFANSFDNLTLKEDT